MKTFYELDIRIFKAGTGSYFVTAEVEGTNPTLPEPLDWRALSREGFIESLRQMREEEFTLKEATVTGVGVTLFDALFRGQVKELFESFYSRDVEPKPETYLRVRIAIDERAPEIAELPWEFLFWKGAFLATHANILLTRQLLNLDYGSIQPLNIAGKPRVLVVIPRGSGLDTDGEEQAIRRILDQAVIPYEVLKGRVFIQSLIDKLRRPGPSPFNILHFIGHGEFERDEGAPPRSILRFNQPDLPDDSDEKEDEVWIDQMQFRQVIAPHRDQLRLVVLNACKGAEVAGEEEKRRGRVSGRGFVGMVPSILMAGAPAVIAMQYEIADSVAKRFAESFYDTLTAGDVAGQVDAATSLARSDCYTNFKEQDWRGFGTPILYLHAKDGAIFELAMGKLDDKGSKPVEDIKAKCPEPHKPDDSLLHDHRYDSTNTLVGSADSLLEQIAGIQRQIDYLEKTAADNPLLAAAGMLAPQADRLKEQKRAKQNELEELKLVLSWKLYEDCMKHASLRQELAEREAERDGLAAQGAWVSYELKNKISDLRKEVRELNDTLEKGKAFWPQ